MGAFARRREIWRGTIHACWNCYFLVDEERARRKEWFAPVVERGLKGDCAWIGCRLVRL